MPSNTMQGTAARIEAASDRDIREMYGSMPLAELAARAASVTLAVHGRDILLRGLVEYSNHCSMNCHYCGIRRDNRSASRYRMNPEDVLDAVRAGFERGFRTFVLQSGEDPWFDAERLSRLVQDIVAATRGEAALTLSAGIMERERYRELRAAGADRYLIRFETSDPDLHARLKEGVTLARRLRAIEDLKAEGFQTGSGFMVGLPGETDETRIGNILLCRALDLDMVGIGPFIPHPDTPLAGSAQIPIEETIRATALVRLALPEAHIPATTAAGSLDPKGREKMIEAGANVLMPNITPPKDKKNYLLYPGKICLTESGEQCVACMDLRVAPLGRRISFARGDSLRWREASRDRRRSGRSRANSRKNRE